MAAFTITTAQNIDALAGKAGGDTYTVNGGTLTIDQDSRYGQNASTSASLGAMTISATLGGTIRVDARKVRLIQYSGGSGLVPASGTTISQGGASGKLIGVWSAVNGAPTAAGVAMPAAGFVKIKQWNDVEFAAGALSGLSANAAGASVVGWIELVGDEAATVTVPRLGLFEMLGEWYACGNTIGAANQTVQLPTSGGTQYFPGLFIEKSAGSGDYEFYANAASQTTVAADIRAKVCWISTAGLARIGHNGTANAGYVPAAGLKIVIPNILCQNCTTAARTANALPNATLASRYDFTTTGGGVISIDKANLAWYPSFAQAFSVALSNTGVLEQISVSEIASPMTWSKVGVGQTAAQAQFALLMSLCFAGGTFTDCVWSRATLAASGAYTVSLTDISGFTFNDDRQVALTARGNATTGNATITRAVNCVWSSPDIVNGRMLFTTCTSCTVSAPDYCDVISGTTATTNAMDLFSCGTNCNGMTFAGPFGFFGLTNVQPYSSLLALTAAGCAGIKLRNIATRDAPLSLGSANQTAYLLNIAAGAAASNVRVQHCYVANTRTNIFTADNSSTGIVFENVAGDYADAPVMPMLNAIFKGIGCTAPLTAQTACYGTHWIDMFTSATAGRLALLANEKTAVEPSASSYTLTGGSPKFTSAGGLYMPTIGDQVTFEMPYYALGHTGFQNAAAVMAGGTIGNYTLEYQIDTGSGWNGTWKMLNGANLSAESVNPALGVRLRIRITTAVTNSTAITSLYVLTNSSAAAQANEYPLDVSTLTLTGIDPGSDVVILAAGTTTVRQSADAIAGGSYAYTYSTAEAVDIGVFKAGKVPLYVRNYSLGTADAVLPIAQVADRAYLE